jgi:hypothetical protein
MLYQVKQAERRSTQRVAADLCLPVYRANYIAINQDILLSVHELVTQAKRADDRGPGEAPDGRPEDD